MYAAVSPKSFPLTPASATDASGSTAKALDASTRKVTLKNMGPNTVYWSNKTAVTTANGFPLASGDSISFGVVAEIAKDLYFVCASTETASVYVLEEA